LSENIDNLWGKSYSQAYSGFVHIDLGEIDRAFETMQRSIELGIKAGFFVPGVILPAMRALTRARLGGGSSDELLVSETTPENFRQVVAPVLNLVKAEIHATRNELDQANKLLDESQDQVAPMSTMYLVFPPELARASYCHAVGQHDKVVEITTDAIKQLSERGIVCRVPQFQCLRAKAFYHLGNQAAAMEALNQGLALTAQSGARWAAWQLLALRAQLRHEAGEDERAADDLHSAAEMVNFIAGHIGEDELHESFLGIPEVAAILDGRYLP
jgi:tetratricopeptide (TPR) repeat protein